MYLTVSNLEDYLQVEIEKMTSYCYANLVFHHDFTVLYSLCLCVLLLDVFKVKIKLTKFSVILNLWACW